jgi:hypothetical protein
MFMIYLYQVSLVIAMKLKAKKILHGCHDIILHSTNTTLTDFAQS